MVKIRLLCIAFLLCNIFSFGQSNLDSTRKIRAIQKKVILAQLNVREETGHNDGYQIDLYRASVAKWLNAMKPKPAWCACFYYFLFYSIDVKLTIRSARAREYFSDKLGSYNPNLRIERPPEFGWPVGYKFGKNAEIRHIGSVYEWNPDPKITMCRILEGNTSSAGVTGVDRDGDGVYIKWRPKSAIYRCTPLNRLKINGK
ncbi:hypothetical protein [Arcicella rosea]|uniref:hypothetical protein n=1 Tax=Arcicella rosea TaxID=502909 RepID=UPI0016120543|nr:hypothetical protein [Arcicella rosea]